MKKNVILFMLIGISVLFLSGCGNGDEEQKQAFFVDTMLFSGSNQNVYITKPGKVSGKQDIVITSQVAGRVKSIEKKDGYLVSGDQLVVAVADTVANYGLQLERAKNAVSRSVLQSKQTKVSLDKSLTDVSLALDVAKNNYDVTQQTSEQSLKQAELGLTNAASQSQNLLLQFPIERTNLLNLMDSILHQINTYLGITEKYKTYNDTYEIYLSAKNSSIKLRAESLLRDLYKIRDEVYNLPSSVDQISVVKNSVETLQKGYDTSKELLDTMKDVLINSVVSVSFPQTTIDGYRATVDGLNSSLQGSKTAFVVYRKQLTSLLSQGEEGSLLDLSKVQAEVSYDTTRINIDNAKFSTEVGVKSAETNYETLQKNKDIQLGMANNAVYEANLAYQDALTRFNNLFVKSPISGVIGNVLVDVGQEIAPGTPLFTVSSNDQQSVEVYVNTDERSYLAQDQIAKIIYDGQEITGTILSISSVADRNTLYKVTIGFEAEVSSLGDVASVKLPISLPYSILPLNVVTPISQNKGFVWLYDGTGLQRQDVVLGRVWESYIEVLSGLSNGMDVVLTDVSYFDPLKFEISVKSD